MRGPSALFILSTGWSGGQCSGSALFPGWARRSCNRSRRAARRDRNGEVLSGNGIWAALRKQFRQHREGQVLLPLYPNDPGSAQSASRSPLAVHQARFSGPETGARLAKNAGRPNPDTTVTLDCVAKLRVTTTYSQGRWNDGLRRRVRGGGGSHRRTCLRRAISQRAGNWQGNFELFGDFAPLTRPIVALHQ